MVMRKTNKKFNSAGFTLIEIMIVVAILGVIGMILPDLVLQTRRFFLLNSAKVDLQKEARGAMYNIIRQLRQAESTTITIDRASSQPHYSRISFTDIDGNDVSYYQNGKNLMMNVDASTSTLTRNLRYIAFSFPRSDDLGIVSVSLTLEKSTYEGRTKALHMASEKVRVMN